MGPFGFIIYVNDIPNSAPDLSLILFADDTSAFTSHKDLSTLNNIMNNGLSKLNTWFKSNKLSLNLKKTNYMLLGTRNKTNQCKDKFKLSLDDTEVKEVSTFKFVGITVDQNLIPGRTMLMILPKSVLVVLVFYIKLRGYCTPGQFLDCFCIFLKNYNTLVTSKICFL